jgi:acyl carrier protein
MRRTVKDVTVEQDTMTRLREIVVSIVGERTQLVPEQVDPGSAFDEPPLSMDSLDFVRFIVEVEEAFGIMAEETDFLNLRTLRDAVATIDRRRKSTADHV